MQATTGRPVAWAAAVAKLASPGSDMVSITMPSAPAEAMAYACSAKAAITSTGAHLAHHQHDATGPDRGEHPDGPDAARREMATPARLTSATWSARPCRASTKRLDPKVLVKMIWLPAST